MNPEHQDIDILFRKKVEETGVDNTHASIHWQQMQTLITGAVGTMPRKKNRSLTVRGITKLLAGCIIVSMAVVVTMKLLTPGKNARPLAPGATVAPSNPAKQEPILRATAEDGVAAGIQPVKGLDTTKKVMAAEETVKYTAGKKKPVPTTSKAKKILPVSNINARAHFHKDANANSSQTGETLKTVPPGNRKNAVARKFADNSSNFLRLQKDTLLLSNRLLYADSSHYKITAPGKLVFKVPALIIPKKDL